LPKAFGKGSASFFAEGSFTGFLLKEVLHLISTLK